LGGGESHAVAAKIDMRIIHGWIEDRPIADVNGPTRELRRK